MGQFRFSIYFHWQIGLMIGVDDYSLDVHLPFITMRLGRLKHARGVDFFGKEFYKKQKK